MIFEASSYTMLENRVDMYDYAQTPLTSGSKCSSKLRAKNLRISVQIYDNAIYLFNVLLIVLYSIAVLFKLPFIP